MKTITLSAEARATARNISIVVLLKMAQYPFLALFLILTPRVLGPEDYGYFALFISIITMAGALLGLIGEQEMFGRFVPELEAHGQPEYVTKLASNTLALKVVINLVFAVVLTPILYVLYGENLSLPLILLVIAILAVRDLYSVAYALLYGLNQIAKFTSQVPLRRILSLVILLVLYHYFGLMGALASILVVDLVLAIPGFFWTRRYYRLDEFRIDLSFLRQYLGFGFLFYLSWTLLNFWQRLGNPLIEWFTGDTREVALYDIPNQVLIVTWALVGTITEVLIPVFTKLLVANREDALVYWSMLLGKYLTIACTIAFWLFVFIGDEGIALFLGEEYAEVYPNGVILLAAIFPMIFAQLAFTFAVIYKQPMRYLQSLAVACIVFVSLCLLLLPRYASLGGSVATLLSTLALTGVMVLFFRRKLGPALAIGGKTLALGLLFAPLLLLPGYGWTSILLALCFFAGYIGLLFYFKLVDIHELQRMVEAIRLRATPVETA